MVPFFELHDPRFPDGRASSGTERRVAIIDGSPSLVRWLVGLETPPEGLLFLRGRDVSRMRTGRDTCAVGATYLPKSTELTLRDWVKKAADTAEREGFSADDARALLDTLGLSFLERTPLAHLPEQVRPRASLAAALASNRPILVADGSTGFALRDHDASEADAWERWCAGREVILLVAKGSAVEPLLASGWVVVGEASHTAPGAAAAWELVTSAPPSEAAAVLSASGFVCCVDDGTLFIMRASGPTPGLPAIAAALLSRSIRLREARPSRWPSAAVTHLYA